MNKRYISAEEFDRLFDEGKEDITPYLDLENVRVVNGGNKRVNVDMPQWMIHQLDREAKRIGVTRQSLVKLWLAERLEKRQ